jgi:hypothetical protein
VKPKDIKEQLDPFSLIQLKNLTIENARDRDDLMMAALGKRARMHSLRASPTDLEREAIAPGKTLNCQHSIT